MCSSPGGRGCFVTNVNFVRAGFCSHLQITYVSGLFFCNMVSKMICRPVWRSISQTKWPAVVLDDFVKWCDEFYFQINISKTKDMTTDHRKHILALDGTSTKGQVVERVQSFKYWNNYWFKTELWTKLWSSVGKGTAASVMLISTLTKQ